MEKNSWAHEYGTSVSCSLMIKAENIAIDELTKNITLANYEIAYKGESVSKVIPPLENDSYSYNVRGKLNETLESVLIRFINEIVVFKEYLHKIKDFYNVYVRIYIQSDFAQNLFALTPDIIKLIADLGLPCEISTLSWGGVVDDGEMSYDLQSPPPHGGGTL